MAGINLGIVTKRCEFAAQVMGADAGLHPDQARWQVGKSRLDLATRPFLPKHDRTTMIVSHDVERVLANIDADHGDFAVGLLRHGVLSSSSLPRASFYHWRGLEHGRERTHRQARSISYRIGGAKFPVLKDIDTFTFADTPIDEGQVRELATGTFLDAKRNAIFIGGTEPAS